jgi:hypothetical protein
MSTRPDSTSNPEPTPAPLDGGNLTAEFYRLRKQLGLASRHPPATAEALAAEVANLRRLVTLTGPGAGLDSSR